MNAYNQNGSSGLPNTYNQNGSSGLPNFPSHSSATPELSHNLPPQMLSLLHSATDKMLFASKNSAYISCLHSFRKKDEENNCLRQKIDELQYSYTLSQCRY